LHEKTQQEKNEKRCKATIVARERVPKAPGGKEKGENLKQDPKKWGQETPDRRRNP